MDKLEQIYECSKCLLYFSPFLKKIDKLYLNWNAFSNSNTVIEAPIPPDQYSSLPLILTDGACSPGSVRVRTYTCTRRNTCFMGCFFQHMILCCMYYSVISHHFKRHYLNHLGFCDTGLPGKPPWEWCIFFCCHLMAAGLPTRQRHAHTSGGLELWKGRVSFDFLLGHLLGTLDRLLHLGPEFLWLPFACVCLCMVVLADYMVGTDPSRDWIC